MREFWYVEVPSCMEWKINSAMVSFNPNCYVEVGKDGVDVKVKALSMCRGRDEALHADRSAINILRITEILSTFTMFNC